MSLPKSTEIRVLTAVARGEAIEKQRARAAVGLVVLIALVLGGAAAWWARRPPPAVVTPSTPADKPLRTSAARLAFRNSFPNVPRLVSAPDAEAPSPAAQARRDAEQARREIDDLFASLRRSKLYSERTAELAVGSISRDISAWAERIYNKDPHLLRPLAQEVEGRLCGRWPGMAELVLLSRLGLLLPQLTSQRGFDCVFSRHQQEDIVTWSLLDSWRHSGLDLSPTLASLQQRATDSRTLRRFMTADQELELRSRRGHGSELKLTRTDPAPQRH
jgi:hypothetical protein